MSGLNKSEKEYWAGRIKEILRLERDRKLSQADISMEDIRAIAKERVNEVLGIADLIPERDHLKEALQEVEAQIKSAYMNKAEELGMRNYYYHGAYGRDNLVEVLLPDIIQSVADEKGVGDVVRHDTTLERELQDAIMLATTSRKLRAFVEKVLDKHEVPDQNALRSLLSYEDE